jgi:tetratricopeptide (TPR) repeat protein
MHQYYLLILLFFFCLPSKADTLSKGELTKIEEICLQSSPECLAYLEIGLNASKPYSRQWFRFKQLRLFNLFDLKKWTLLRQEVNYWLLDDKMPTNFAVYVYIYHAKLKFSEQSTAEYTHYLTKATNLLSEINTKSFSPLRLIEIANLQISLQNYAQAKQTLKQLDKKFAKRDYPVFKQELYANLGHIALKENNHEEHIQYRQKSLKWALNTPNQQQIAIAYANLAWAYQAVKQYKKSAINYKTSIDYSKKVHDDNTTIRSQMRLVQVLCLQGIIDEAEKLYTHISMNSFNQLTSETNYELYQELQILLNIN